MMAWPGSDKWHRQEERARIYRGWFGHAMDEHCRATGHAPGPRQALEERAAKFAERLAETEIEQEELAKIAALERLAGLRDTTAPPTWEYTEVLIGDDKQWPRHTFAYLNDLSAQGWELVAIIGDRYTLKRQRRRPEPEAEAGDG